MQAAPFEYSSSSFNSGVPNSFHGKFARRLTEFCNEFGSRRILVGGVNWDWLDWAPTTEEVTAFASTWKLVAVSSRPSSIAVVAVGFASPSVAMAAQGLVMMSSCPSSLLACRPTSIRKCNPVRFRAKSVGAAVVLRWQPIRSFWCFPFCSSFRSPYLFLLGGIPRHVYVHGDVDLASWITLKFVLENTRGIGLQIYAILVARYQWRGLLCPNYDFGSRWWTSSNQQSCGMGFLAMSMGMSTLRHE